MTVQPAATCRECGITLRPRGTTLEQHPGTKCAGSPGICTKCYQATRREALHVPEASTRETMAGLAGWLHERRARIARASRARVIL